MFCFPRDTLLVYNITLSHAGAQILYLFCLLLQPAVNHLTQVIKSYTTVVLLNKICHLIVLKVVGFY